MMACEEALSAASKSQSAILCPCTDTEDSGGETLAASFASAPIFGAEASDGACRIGAFPDNAETTAEAATESVDEGAGRSPVVVTEVKGEMAEVDKEAGAPLEANGATQAAGLACSRDRGEDVSPLSERIGHTGMARLDATMPAEECLQGQTEVQRHTSGSHGGRSFVAIPCKCLEPCNCANKPRASGRRPRVQLLEVEGSGLGIPVAGRNGKEPDLHLRISDGKYVGSVYRIPSIDRYPGIGRSRTNDVCLLADDQVSRFQAHLTSTSDGHVLLRDGGHEPFGHFTRSSNGTFVNSNCVRIELAGHRLYYGDVISVGATEMVVEKGAVAETVCTSPPLQIPGTNNGWIRVDTDNPWKRQMEKGLASNCVNTCMSLGRRLAVLMGSHKRLGRVKSVYFFCFPLVSSCDGGRRHLTVFRGGVPMVACFARRGAR